MKYTLGPIGKQKELDFHLIPFRNKGLTVPGILGGYTKLGVYFSGGLDSTITLCLILDELRKSRKIEEVSVTCFTVVKTSGSTYYASRMLEKVRKVFDCDINHITNLDNPDIDKTPTPLSFSTIAELVGQYKDTLFFTGLMSYPDSKEKDFVYKESMSNIPNIGLRNYKVVQPLTHLYKYHVVDLYYQMNLDSLIPYTHTCTKQSIGTCNMCTGCEERQWAFDVLSKTDPEPIMPDIEDLSNNGSWKF